MTTLCLSGHWARTERTASSYGTSWAKRMCPLADPWSRRMCGSFSYGQSSSSSSSYRHQPSGTGCEAFTIFKGIVSRERKYFSLLLLYLRINFLVASTELQLILKIRTKMLLWHRSLCPVFISHWLQEKSNKINMLKAAFCWGFQGPRWLSVDFFRVAALGALKVYYDLYVIW